MLWTKQSTEQLGYNLLPSVGGWRLSGEYNIYAPQYYKYFNVLH